MGVLMSEDMPTLLPVAFWEETKCQIHRVTHLLYCIHTSWKNENVYKIYFYLFTQHTLNYTVVCIYSYTFRNNKVCNNNHHPSPQFDNIHKTKVPPIGLWLHYMLLTLMELLVSICPVSPFRLCGPASITDHLSPYTIMRYGGHIHHARPSATLSSGFLFWD